MARSFIKQRSLAMRVKALEKLYYDRRDVHPGDEYEMDDRESNEIKILEALGKIKVLGPAKPEPEPAAEPEPVNIEESEEQVDENELHISRSHGRYRRKDLRSEK
jgi:ribosomal 50S subunit-recycling heat shock protein